MFQLDDSQSLHGKWLFHQISIKNWLSRVPGIYTFHNLPGRNFQQKISRHALCLRLRRLGAGGRGLRGNFSGKPTAGTPPKVNLNAPWEWNIYLHLS